LLAAKKSDIITDYALDTVSTQKPLFLRVKEMLNKILIKSHSEQDTIDVGRAIGSVLMSGDFITLLGDLGSGKTRLAKGIISEALGIPVDEVISPSFTLVNRYEGSLTIDHADLYRVGGKAVEELGLMEILQLQGALLIEWASDEDPVSESELRVFFISDENDNYRLLELNFVVSGAWDERFQNFLENRSIKFQTLEH
jgi:tRNA threonylcarbamoyladenosine biosynthesis protein TsaE